MTTVLTREEAAREGRALQIKNPVVRRLFIVLGGVALVVGLIGIPLPVLPTTPFLLLAAALWARSSERLLVWLLTHRRFGPPIVSYRRNGNISTANKALAVTMIGVSMTLAIVYAVPVLPGKIGMAAIGLLVSTWILSRPSVPGARTD